jgi:acyl-coenzyme A synthetase/AMP-(fatty) acid ligase
MMKGLQANLIPRESCAGVFGPKWFWERIRQGGVSIFDIAAIGYDRLAEYFDEHIAILPTTEREIYVREIAAVKVASTSGSVLPLHTQERWTSLRRGKPLLNLYGSTEMTLICCMRWESLKYSDMVFFSWSQSLFVHADFVD